MDFFTHALVPYSVSRLLKKERDATLASAIGGISPDLDMFIAIFAIFFPEFYILTHRGIGHSFLFSSFFSTFLLFTLTRKRIKNYFFKLNFNKKTIIFAYFGAIIHVLLDFITTNGVMLLYPLNEKKYSLEIFFYISPILEITSICLVILLYKGKIKKENVNKYLVLFLCLIILLGGIRYDLKENLKLYENETVYPSRSIFSWWIVKNNNANEEYLITKYNYLNKEFSNSTSFKYILINNISEKKMPLLNSSLEKTRTLSKTKLFELGAYLIAINISDAQVDTIKIEYYDPLRKSMLQDNNYLRNRKFFRKFMEASYLINDTNIELL